MTTDDPNAEPGCVHHWRIGEAVSPEVGGTCLKCGAERSFRTGWEIPWEPGSNAAIHGLFATAPRNWAGEWLSERQRAGWQW